MAQDVLRLAAIDRGRVARLAPEAVLVVPIGAIEQHGPSLPLGTDAALAESVAEAGIAAASTSRPLVLAPTIPYGNSEHHLFACAGSVSSATLLLMLADLIDSFVRSGFRRIFVLNGHGGNDECVHLAVKDAVNRHPVVLGAASYWTLAPEGGFPAGTVPGHAGAFEASLLMAARGDLL
ncbi:MAG: creatininase family protein, partial [Stackebrandtia sp.]